MTMNRPMSVLQHADRSMQSAEALFRDKKSIMMIDDRNLVEDHMDWLRLPFSKILKPKVTFSL